MFTRLLLPMAILFGLAACNTVEGAGEDISSAGNAIESEAAAAQ